MNARSAPKVCTTCGARYAADALFCPADGTPLTTAAAAAARQSDAGTDTYLGREISGHIEIRQLAGVGAMGRVYRAFQRGIDRDVAVKVLHRELSANAQLVARFHREAKVASRLQHPNVVAVHLAGQLPDGAMYIVMEYLDGLSLQSALAAAGGAMPLPRALHVALQLCDAAGEAHAQGVVHRDLKPENVMLVHRGDDPDFVKVLDFGIARLNWGEQSMATAAGLIFGTARYISPEGAQGETVGPSGDVYSIATLLYQMLAGRTPFEGEQAVGLLVQQIHEQPPLLKSIARASYVPEPIAQLVMKNLAKRPADRAPDARVLGRALLDAAKASGLSPEDLVGRSALLGARGAMQLPPMQRTKQLQLEREIAEKLEAPAFAHSPAPPAAHALSPAAPSTRTVGMPMAPPREIAAGTRKMEAPPPELAAVRPPVKSNVDITLDDATAPPLPPMPRESAPSGPGNTLPVTPMSPQTAAGAPAEGEVKPARERPRSTEIAGPTLQSEGDAGAGPRRGGFRWLGVVAICFLLGIGITTIVAYKMNLIGPSALHGTLEEQLAKSNDALRQKRWDEPAGDNVRDLTNDGLARWPGEPRLREVREHATDELVKEAVGRKFAGDLPGALHLAKLARELDPTDTTAQHLADEFEALSKAAIEPIAIVPALDAGLVVPSGKAPVTASGNFRAAMDVSPAKPHVGQVVALVVKVTTSSGASPKKPLTDPSFQIGGAAMGASGPASLPALAEGTAIFRASFTFLAPGKYEITFNAKSDGVSIKTTRAIVADETTGASAPTAAPEQPPPAPTGSAKWL